MDTEKNIKLAPVILFAYNRLQVLTHTLEALQKNTLAKDTELFIFSDGPKKHKHGDIERVQSVRKFIHKISGFKHVKVFEQDENIGLADSVISGISAISRLHDTFIVLEDDLITSPYFLEYMNAGLQKYKHEKQVWCINGMSINAQFLELPKDYSFDTYFLYRNSSHGWGSWSDRWNKSIWDNNKIEEELFDLGQRFRFNRGGDDLYPMMEDWFLGKTNSWCIRFSYSISKYDGYCLTPRNSYVTAQASKDGTHIKGYNHLIDNNVSLALQRPNFPDTISIIPQIATRFALNYRNTIPALLREDMTELERRIMSKEHASLKIGQISTIIYSGAGYALQRLSTGLFNMGIYNELYVLGLHGVRVDSLIIRSMAKKNRTQDFLDKLSNENTYEGNTMFSFPHKPVSFSVLDMIIRNNDVVHIHWIGGLLSVENIAYLSHQDKPIVWTIHDKNPLTGGCHCFHGCNKWTTHCNECSQLKNTYADMPAAVLESKKKYINFKNITVVVLNQHFKELFEKSPLFNESRIEIIPNGIDTEKFIPYNSYNPEINFEKLKIPQLKHMKKNFILYVAAYKSTIKGYKEFCEMLNYILDANKFHVLLVGNLPKERNIRIPYTEFGFVNQDMLISLYQLSDVVVVSSLEDNLPNICLESLSCGTPVVGFKVGGIPDIIRNGYTGYTVPVGDCKALATALELIIEGPDLSANCREYAEQNLRLDIQVNRYVCLYKDVIANSVRHSNLNPSKIISKTNFPEMRNSMVNIQEEILCNMSNELNTLEELSHTDSYRFIKGSYKVKLWMIAKKIVIMLGLFTILQPFVSKIKSYLQKYK